MKNNQATYYEACESEPLHFIGAIQSHGALIAGNVADHTIRYVSDNLEAYTGHTPKQLLGEKFEQFFPELADQFQQITSARKVIFGGVQGKNGRLDVLYLKRSGNWQLELFARDDNSRLNDGLFHAHQSSLFNLAEHYSNNLQLNNLILQAIQDFTGFEHIMLYRFLEDESGEVIAEINNSDTMESYLGLRFPASDIPRIARRLYTLNPYRAITDVEAPVSKLLGIEEKALDLSYSDLRASSPVHIEYLQNMQVRASLSFPIQVKGEFWGLVACHSAEPKPVSLERKEACASLVSSYAMTLNYYLAQQHLQVIDDVEKQNQTLASFLLYRPDPDATRDELADRLMQVADASGLSYFDGESLENFGQCPDETVIEAIRSYCENQQSAPIFHSNHLASLVTLPEDTPQVISGFLWMRLQTGGTGGPWLALYRPELPAVIKWAGNPGKPQSTIDEQGREKISPRNSFKVWQQEMHNISAPWTSQNTMIATRMRKLALYLMSSKDLQAP